MTGRKVKKEKGPDSESGNMMYEVITLTKGETVIYELLERILEAVEK